MKHCLFLLAFSLLSVSQINAGQFVYVSESGDDTIAIYRQNPSSGELTFIERQETDGSPGSLDTDPHRRFLFAALRSTKTLASYQIDPDTGLLTLLSTTDPEEDPTYVHVDRSGQWLLSASYGAGQVAVHRIRDDGRLEPRGRWHKTAEKAHAIRLDPLNNFAYVPHTGPERIYQFEFDRQTGELTPNDPPFIETPQGYGPRHIWFHPRLHRAYGDNEQGSSVTAYEYDVEEGVLQPRDTLSTLPDDFAENNSNADIELTPDGRFLYVSNRGHDSIAGFAVDGQDGTLRSLGTFATEQTPRSFSIDSNGRYLYAAGQQSDRLAAYRIQNDGALVHTATHETGKSPAWVQAVNTEFNYDESRVPQFDLPDPLVTLSGESVTDEAAWRDVRRPEIMRLFEEHVYGASPERPENVPFEITTTEEDALDGKARRKEVTIWFLGEKQGPSMSLLMYLPHSSEPSPAFLGLNFGGNHSISDDPGITLNTGWFRDRPERGYVDNRATEQTRGASASRWPVEMILKRGYAVCTIYYGDIDPDFDDEFQNGVHPLFDRETDDERAPHAWGSIAAWAWGLSRGLDYLELDDDVDASRVAVLGHSRLGKTSLWAGAQDERFALVISNDSGCGGAALSRRGFGETVARINTSFPHWFCDGFNQYNGNEDALPVDQHLLIALMAPRPVYIASAVEDRWADPRGEFLSGYHASPVYRLFAKQGLLAEGDPDVDEPRSSGSIGYHVRSGGHDVTRFDWQQYLDFADRHLREQ